MDVLLVYDCYRVRASGIPCSVPTDHALFLSHAFHARHIIPPSCSMDVAFLAHGSHVLATWIPYPYLMDVLLLPHASYIPVTWTLTPLTWTPSTCSITAMFPCQACHTLVRGCPAPVPWMQLPVPRIKFTCSNRTGTRARWSRNNASMGQEPDIHSTGTRYPWDRSKTSMGREHDINETWDRSNHPGNSNKSPRGREQDIHGTCGANVTTHTYVDFSFGV